jgi:hypothetical protein
VAAAVSAGCATGTAPERVVTRTQTLTASPATGPVPAGETTVRATPCPLLKTSVAADAVGMRLARSEVLVNRGRVTGCRFYALQRSPLHTSERLPGPDQPVLAVTSGRYRSADAARAELVTLAHAGRNPQRADVEGAPGACYQDDFSPADGGRDWACAFAVGTTVVLVRTVVTSPALTVVQVARAVLPEF